MFHSKEKVWLYRPGFPGKIHSANHEAHAGCFLNFTSRFEGAVVDEVDEVDELIFQTEISGDFAAGCWLEVSWKRPISFGKLGWMGKALCRPGGQGGETSQNAMDFGIW